MWAAIKDRVEISTLLVEAGSNLNVTSNVSFIGAPS